MSGERSPLGVESPPAGGARPCATAGQRDWGISAAGLPLAERHHRHSRLIPLRDDDAGDALPGALREAYAALQREIRAIDAHSGRFALADGVPLSIIRRHPATEDLETAARVGSDRPGQGPAAGGAAAALRPEPAERLSVGNALQATAQIVAERRRPPAWPPQPSDDGHPCKASEPAFTMATLLEDPDARSRASIRPAPAPHRAQHTPTFVDDAGRRRRLAARAGRVLVAIAALWLAAVASAFLAFPALPAPALRSSATVASAVNGGRSTGAAGARSAYVGNGRRAPASGEFTQRLTTADRERPHPYRRGASAGRAHRQAPARNTTGAVTGRYG